MNKFAGTSARKSQYRPVAVFSGDSYNERLRKKTPPPEFVTFWSELATLGGKPVAEPVTPAYSRTPAELNRRAKNSAAMRLSKMRLGKQNNGKAKGAKKKAER